MRGPANKVPSAPAKQPTLIRFSLDDEPVIIGAALSDEQSRKQLARRLVEDDFVEPKHRALWRAVQALDRGGLEYHEDTVARLAGGADSFGGYAYLRALVADYGKPIKNADFHVGRVRLTRLRNEIASLFLQELIKTVEDPKTTVDELAAITKALAAKVRGLDSMRVHDATDVAKATYRAFQLSRTEDGLGFYGFEDEVVDRLLSRGLRPGDTSVLGARPGVGKTTFAARLMRLRAKAGRGTCYVLCEGEPKDLGLMMASQELKLPFARLTREASRMTAAEVISLERYLTMIHVPGLFEVVENPFDGGLGDRSMRREWGSRNARNLETLETVCARTSHRLVVLDLVGFALPEQRVELLDEAIVEMTRIAKRTNVHLMLVHHLKRADPRAAAHRPTMDDLRASGGFEQYCDAIYLLDRPKKRGDRKYQGPDVMDLICEKQRDGSEFHVRWAYKGSIRDFTDAQQLEYMRADASSDPSVSSLLEGV